MYKIQFIDSDELRHTVPIFTGPDILAKQHIISKHGNISYWNEINT